MYGVYRWVLWAKSSRIGLKVWPGSPACMLGSALSFLHRWHQFLLCSMEWILFCLFKGRMWERVIQTQLWLIFFNFFYVLSFVISSRIEAQVLVLPSKFHIGHSQLWMHINITWGTWEKILKARWNLGI